MIDQLIQSISHKKHKPNILLETISHFHFSFSHNMHNNLL